MKTMKILSAALLIGAVAMSCQKQPDAKISASKTTVEVNENITFTNSSTDANSYDWDFGDNQTSNLASPSHNWSNAGLYSVNMTVYSKNEKKKDNANLTITVNNVNKKFEGIYSMSGNCGPGSYTLTITISGTSSLMINNFGNSGWNYTATVIGNNFTMPEQLKSDTYGDYYVSATGTLNGTQLTINALISYYDYTNSSYNYYDVPCTDVGTK